MRFSHSTLTRLGPSDKVKRAPTYPIADLANHLKVTPTKLYLALKDCENPPEHRMLNGTRTYNLKEFVSWWQSRK